MVSLCQEEKGCHARLHKQARDSVRGPIMLGLLQVLDKDHFINYGIDDGGCNKDRMILRLRGIEFKGGRPENYG
jgi:hypothetical protein